MNAIECKHIVRKVALHQRTETILDIDHFVLKEKEQLCMMGPSGSGKTTLLHLLAGLTIPSSGSIVTLGENLATKTEAERDQFRGENIGVVFQEFDLFPYMTALENVLVQNLANPKGKKSDMIAKAKELLQTIGLEKRMNVKVELLSRGQQQRVAIARALIHRPKLLLIDEPTSNLDVKTGSEVIQMIKKVSEGLGCALVIVTHDPTIASFFPKTMKMEEINKVYEKSLKEVVIT